MSDNSRIGWTDATWNALYGCEKIAPGCANCYAVGVMRRLEGMHQAAASGLVKRNSNGMLDWNGKIFLLGADRIEQPLRWKRGRKIFVNSLSDLFHEDVPREFIVKIFAVMAATSSGKNHHTFQILTKRPARMQELLSDDAFVDEVALAMGEYTHAGIEEWPLPNVWMGTSVAQQSDADANLPELLQTPAAVRWVSYEPAVGPIDFKLTPYRLPNGCMLDVGGRVRLARDQAFEIPSADVAIMGLQLGRDHSPGSEVVDRPASLNWLVVGGESGHNARPFDISWARSVVKQGQAAGVPVFVKQLGAKPRVGFMFGTKDIPQPLPLRDSHGADPAEWPEDLRVQQFPGVTLA